MTNSGADSTAFEAIIRGFLGAGLSVRFQARGASMSPAIRDGEMVEVIPASRDELGKGDIVLAKSAHGFRLHRIVRADHEKDVFITRGDCSQQDDPQLSGIEILGVARSKEVRVGRFIVRADLRGVRGWALQCVARGQTLAAKLVNKIPIKSDETARFRQNTSPHA